MDQHVLNQPGGAIPAGSRAPADDPHSQVVSAIRTYQGTTIAVPELSHLLGVKSTTLNARLRREHIAVSMIGRTSYVSCQLALQLAELHKYALIGWPTIREASLVTKVKPATIKARCEKGQLEGYLDLTKRLRINPAAFETLQIRGSKDSIRGSKDSRTSSPVVIPPAGSRMRPGLPDQKWVPGAGECRPPALSHRASAPGLAPVIKVRLITAADYGFSESHPNLTQALVNRPQNRRPLGPLGYDPEQPPCVSQCSVGKSISYGHYEGRILQVIDDPFSPKIKVHFPTHDLPVMREVLLAVARRKILAASPA